MLIFYLLKAILKGKNLSSVLNYGKKNENVTLLMWMILVKED